MPDVYSNLRGSWGKQGGDQIWKKENQRGHIDNDGRIE